MDLVISDYNASCSNASCTRGTGKAMYKFVFLYFVFQFLFSIFNLLHHGFNIIDANSLCWVPANQNQ